MKLPDFVYIFTCFITVCFIGLLIGYASWLSSLWGPQTAVAMFGNSTQHYVAMDTQSMPQPNTNNI